LGRCRARRAASFSRATVVTTIPITRITIASEIEHGLGAGDVRVAVRGFGVRRGRPLLPQALHPTASRNIGTSADRQAEVLRLLAMILVLTSAEAVCAAEPARSGC
jgi:hypothetical protein